MVFIHFSTIAVNKIKSTFHNLNIFPITLTSVGAGKSHLLCAIWQPLFNLIPMKQIGRYLKSPSNTQNIFEERRQPPPQNMVMGDYKYNIPGGED